MRPGSWIGQDEEAKQSGRGGSEKRDGVVLGVGQAVENAKAGQDEGIVQATHVRYELGGVIFFPVNALRTSEMTWNVGLSYFLDRPGYFSSSSLVVSAVSPFRIL